MNQKRDEDLERLIERFKNQLTMDKEQMSFGATRLLDEFFNDLRALFVHKNDRIADSQQEACRLYDKVQELRKVIND